MKKLDLRKNEDDRSTKLNRANFSQKREESKNNILEIIRTDFQSAFRNPIIIMVLGCGFNVPKVKRWLTGGKRAEFALNYGIL